MQGALVDDFFVPIGGAGPIPPFSGAQSAPGSVANFLALKTLNPLTHLVALQVCSQRPQHHRARNQRPSHGLQRLR